MQLDPEIGVQVEALQADLARLGPVAVPAPAAIRTAHAFHAVRLGELRKLARRWVRENNALPPNVVAKVAERLWFSDSREAMIVSTMLLEKRRDARDLLEPGTFEHWASEFDGWELVDNLGMAVIAPWVWDHPEAGLRVLESFASSSRAWTRRLALVGTLDLAGDVRAEVYWPRIRALCVALARDREAAIPKAISWVLRTYARHVPGLVAEFVRDDQARVPAVARRETLHFLEFGRKRSPKAD